MSKNKSFRRVRKREVARRRRPETQLREEIARQIRQLPASIFGITAKS